MTIENQFSAALRTAIEEAKQLGYHPTRFETMLNDMGAVPLAKKLVISGDLQDGLKKMKQLGRLDLTLEHIMQNEPFHPLFSKAELAAADWRLQQARDS